MVVPPDGSQNSCCALPLLFLRQMKQTGTNQSWPPTLHHEVLSLCQDVNLRQSKTVPKFAQKYIINEKVIKLVYYFGSLTFSTLRFMFSALACVPMKS